MTRPVYEDEEDLKRERELTLGTGVILGIFLALVVLCGAFFGFGYKMGSRQPVPLGAAASTEGAQPSSGMFSGFKPAAGSPMGSSAASGSQPAAVASGPREARGGAPSAPSAPPVAAPVAHAATPVVTAPEQPAATGNFVVQVAAVSHEEDAQLLVSALRAKGYPVNAQTESADKFFHIQVGPFTNMKDAAAAKQRLLADGYQPIIK
jgi:cell division septation protein DedD